MCGWTSKKFKFRRLHFKKDEPILGKTYLPRKFKTVVVIPPLNDVDCCGYDLVFVAVSDR